MNSISKISKELGLNLDFIYGTEKSSNTLKIFYVDPNTGNKIAYNVVENDFPTKEGKKSFKNFLTNAKTPQNIGKAVKNIGNGNYMPIDYAEAKARSGLISMSNKNGVTYTININEPWEDNTFPNEPSVRNGKVLQKRVAPNGDIYTEPAKPNSNTSTPASDASTKATPATEPAPAPQADTAAKPAPTTESAKPATDTSTKATPTSQSTNPSSSTQAPKPEPTITGPAEGSSTSGTKKPNLADLADDSEGAYMREDTLHDTNPKGGRKRIKLHNPTASPTPTPNTPEVEVKPSWKIPWGKGISGILGGIGGWLANDDKPLGERVLNTGIEAATAVNPFLFYMNTLNGANKAFEEFAPGPVVKANSASEQALKNIAKKNAQSFDRALGGSGEPSELESDFGFSKALVDYSQNILKKSKNVEEAKNNLYKTLKEADALEGVASNTDINANADANNAEAKDTNTDNSSATTTTNNNTPVVANNNKNNTNSTETTTPATPIGKVSTKGDLYYTGGNPDKAKSQMKTLWSDAGEEYINNVKNTADFKQSRAEYDAPEYKGLSNEKKDQRAAADILELQKRASAKKKVAPKSGTVYNAPAKATSANTEEDTDTIDLKNIKWYKE